MQWPPILSNDTCANNLAFRLIACKCNLGGLFRPPHARVFHKDVVHLPYPFGQVIAAAGKEHQAPRLRIVDAQPTSRAPLTSKIGRKQPELYDKRSTDKIKGTRPLRTRWNRYAAPSCNASNCSGASN